MPAAISTETQPTNLHVATSEKVGRNDPCPCGSGKKITKPATAVIAIRNLN